MARMEMDYNMDQRQNAGLRFQVWIRYFDIFAELLQVSCSVEL